MFSDFNHYEPANVFQPYIPHNGSNISFYRSHPTYGAHPQQVNSASLAYSQLLRKAPYSQKLHEPSSSEFLSVFGFINNYSKQAIKQLIKNTSWCELYKVEFLPFCYPEHIYFSKLVIPLVSDLDLFELKTLTQAVKQDIPDFSVIIRPYAKNLLEIFEKAYNQLAYDVNVTVNILKDYFDDIELIAHRNNTVNLSHLTSTTNCFEFFLPANWIPPLQNNSFQFALDFLNLNTSKIPKLEVKGTEIQSLDLLLVNMGFVRQSFENDKNEKIYTNVFISSVFSEPNIDQNAQPSVSDSSDWDAE